MRRAVATWVLVMASSACGRLGFDELEQALSLTPPEARSNLNTTTQFLARGGAPPYTFALAAGEGELDSATGAFRAPSTPGAATIAVTDAGGDEATAAISFGGEYAYVIGGFLGEVATDSVWRTTDGAQWELIGHLPAPRGGSAVLVLEDQLFVVGGAIDPEGARFHDVWTSADGVEWTEVGRLPEPAGMAGAAVHRGRMWTAGGRLEVDNFTDQVWSSADGASWQAELPLAVGLHGSELTVFGDALWLVAGHESPGETAAVWRRGEYGGWDRRGDVPVAGEYHGVSTYAGAMWVAGGSGLRDRLVRSDDGATWSDGARLPIPREFHALLAWQDALWAIGGLPAHTWRSVGGGPWAVTSTFPTQVATAGVVQFTPAPSP